MKATHYLKTATDLIGGQRETDYGEVKANHDNIARLWSAYFQNECAVQGMKFLDREGDECDQVITAADVLKLMSLLKVGRSQQGKHKDDNYADAAGYIALAGEVESGR